MGNCKTLKPMKYEVVNVDLGLNLLSLINVTQKLSSSIHGCVTCGVGNSFNGKQKGTVDSADNDGQRY